MNYWHFFKDKESTVTSFYLDHSDLSKWMYQNKAEYTGDFVDGVLLDSFVVSTKRGYAFFYEHFRNEWTSDYTVYFIPYESGKKHLKVYDLLWAEWLDFESKAQMETA